MKSVGEYTFRDISSVYVDTPLSRVIKIMVRNHIGAVPVVNKLGEYIGCISEHDILAAAVPGYMKIMRSTLFMAEMNKTISHLKGLLDHPAKDFMDRNYPTISVNDKVSFAAETMYRLHHKILPVLEGKRLVGLLTRIDILAISLEGIDSNLDDLTC